MKRILALLMATVMICMAFAGCGNKADDKKADPTVITKDVYVGGLIYTESMIQQNAGFALGDYLDVEIGEGMTGADLIKDNADDLFHEFECVKLIAEEKGIKVTDGIHVVNQLTLKQTDYPGLFG